MMILPMNLSKLGLPLLLTLSIGGLFGCSTSAQTQVQVAPSPSIALPAGGGHGMGEHNMMMDLGPADANFDLRFIDSMIPHHQGAVVMAKDVLQNSKRPELRNLATTIIRAQEKEIDQMQRWRKQWYANVGETPMAWHAPMGHMMAMTAEQRQSMMMQMNLGPADSNFDLRFINAMIPHHQGALTMARAASANGQRQELKVLAQEILASQEVEIKQMQQWRKAWYGK
jgi:uncharacterized protein (DUF305 family)